MKRIPGHSRTAAAAALVVLLGLAGPTALAQAELEPEGFPERLDEIPDRVEEAMRGLIDRMKPALEDAFELMDVLGEIDSPKHYEKPVILPDGDILIRRRDDAPEWAPDEEDLDSRPRPRPRHLDPNEGTPI